MKIEYFVRKPAWKSRNLSKIMKYCDKMVEKDKKLKQKNFRISFYFYFCFYKILPKSLVGLVTFQNCI